MSEEERFTEKYFAGKEIKKMTIKVRKEVGEISMIGIWGKAGKAVKKKKTESPQHTTVRDSWTMEVLTIPSAQMIRFYPTRLP